MWSDGSIILPQTAHDEPTQHLLPPEKGGQRDRGGTNHICGVLPQVNPVVKVTGTGLPCGSTQCRKAAGTFHVPTFLVLYSGGPRGK